MLLNAAGILGSICDTAGCFSDAIRCMTANTVLSPVRSNGVLRTSSSYSTTPSEKMSERGSTGCPVTASGDMYLGEPSAEPVCVIDDDATCATPKSVTFARQSADTMMLAGLMSRCVI